MTLRARNSRIGSVVGVAALVTGCTQTFVQPQTEQLRRLVIGFGVGASEVDAEIEVLQATPRGPVRIAQFAAHADSGDMPGAAVTMGAGAAASGGLTVGVAAASVTLSGVNAYHSEVERMAGRSADRAADYLSRVFAQQGRIAPQQ